MEYLASLFVGKPLNILTVAAFFLIGYCALRFTTLGRNRRPGMLLGVAFAWTLYAAWEWLVLVRTPEANIRVDLLLIWPVMAFISAWLMFRSLRYVPS